MAKKPTATAATLARWRVARDRGVGEHGARRGRQRKRDRLQHHEHRGERGGALAPRATRGARRSRIPPNDPIMTRAPRLERLSLVVEPGREALRLQLEEPRVGSLRAHELVVIALLDHPSAVDHHDPVGATHAREAVGDEQRRHAAGELDERVEERGLGAHVERRGRLVEHEHRRSRLERVERPCDREALPLPAREVDPALVAAAQRRVEPERVGREGREGSGTVGGATDRRATSRGACAAPRAMLSAAESS